MTNGSLMLNPGSSGAAAGAAFAGRVVGGLPGLLWAYSVTKDTVEGQTPSAPVGATILRFVGQISGAAGGAYLAAPEPLRTRAAIGAAIGGAVPLIGAPLAAVGAYVATRPPSPNRAQNPISPLTTALLIALGLATAGGLYAGMKIWRAREAEKVSGGGTTPTPENVDEWGTDMDKNEYWGAGPVPGQDGNEYAYVIYHNLEDDSYWYAWRGTGGGGSAGPFNSGNDAAWCVENRLPLPCVGQGSAQS